VVGTSFVACCQPTPMNSIGFGITSPYWLSTEPESSVMVVHHSPGNSRLKMETKTLLLGHLSSASREASRGEEHDRRPSLDAAILWSLVGLSLFENCIAQSKLLPSRVDSVLGLV